VIWRAVHGAYDIGRFYFITNAIMQANSNLQQVFSTASGIADQALFLTDLIAFFDMKPAVYSKPDGLPAPRPIQRGFEFRNVSFAYPGTTRAFSKISTSPSGPASASPSSAKMAREKPPSSS